MVDRTNGKRFTLALRAAGLKVTTLKDVWGKLPSQHIESAVCCAYP